jgi:hypothetical protein
MENFVTLKTLFLIIFMGIFILIHLFLFKNSFMDGCIEHMWIFYIALYLRNRNIYSTDQMTENI